MSMLFRDFVLLSVSGTRYEILKSTLSSFPGSLLHTLAFGSVKECPSEVIRKGDSFFIQRSPQFFDMIILQCYITGKLHVPKWMCSENVLEELKFWRLDIQYACSCCAEEKEEINGSETNSSEVTTCQDEIGTANKQVDLVSSWEKIRRKVWDLLEHPSTSFEAVVFSIISFCFVLLSIGTVIADSIDEVSSCPIDLVKSFVPSTNNSANSSLINYDYNNSVVTYNQFYWDLGVFSQCEKKKFLQIFELTTLVWFTCELFIRLLFCPNLKLFFKSPMNLIDILAVFPYFIEIVLAIIQVEDPNVIKARSMLTLTQILRCFRVFRILKLARYFQELRILGKTFKSAKDELFMLIMFIVIAIFVFACTIYQFEKNEPDTQFTSIPAACWWGIVTLTTVGYGDYVPKSVGGKIVSSVACVTGILITAFPVSILVEHFTTAYKNKRKKMFVIPKFHYHVPSFHKRHGHRHHRVDEPSDDLERRMDEKFGKFRKRLGTL